MKLTLLGTGDFRSLHPHGTAGYMLESKLTTLKLDFGQGNLLNMARAGLDWRKINAILISHIHPDHISDLFQYLQALTVSFGFGEIESGRTTLYGPQGFPDYFQHFRQAVTTVWNEMPEVHELFEETFVVGNMKITSKPMIHTVHCVGYRIESEGKVLCYTGDTEYNENLVQLAEGADILLTECADDNAGTGENHMRPSDIARVANTAKVKKVVLTHYPGDEPSRQKRKKHVEETFSGEVIAGEDLQVIEL